MAGISLVQDHDGHLPFNSVGANTAGAWARSPLSAVPAGLLRMRRGSGCALATTRTLCAPGRSSDDARLRLALSSRLETRVSPLRPRGAAHEAGVSQHVAVASDHTGGKTIGAFQTRQACLLVSSSSFAFAVT